MINRTEHHIDVMISSTSKDLPDHRKQAMDAVVRAGMFPRVMETLGARLGNSIEESLKMVDRAEIYIGIFGNRYGYIPNDSIRNPLNLSITELEYRRALEREIPILIFVMDEDHPVPSDPQKAKYFYEDSKEGRQKLDVLKSEIMSRFVVGMFTSPENLKALVLEALLRDEVRERALEKVGEFEQETDVRANDWLCPPKLYSITDYFLTHTFIGRHSELQMLDNWAASENTVMVIEAIGGVGKSAIAWEWVQRLNKKDEHPFVGIIWWSFYERGAKMEDFIRHALAYITCQDPESDKLKDMTYDQRVRALTRELKDKKYLIAMDGLERILVAYHRIDKEHIPDDMVQNDYNQRDCIEPRDSDFLRSLVACEQSKILITSRLMPRALEDTNEPVRYVVRHQLNGLSPEDAKTLMYDMGVTKADKEVLNEFMARFGYHSLLLKVIAGRIKNHRLAPGDFDTWYDLRGREMHLAEKKIQEVRETILKYALDGLDESQMRLLSQIAVYSGAVPFSSIQIFNPYIAPHPPLPELPPIPLAYTSPFGSRRMAELRRLLEQAMTDDEHQQLEEELYKEQNRYGAYHAFLTQRVNEIERQQKIVIQQRKQAIKQAEIEYSRTDEYRRGMVAFDADLTDLEDRGLLQWDRDSDSYDLHPVVRGFAFDRLPDHEKTEAFDRVRNHFGDPSIDLTEVREVVDINQAIEIYKATLRSGFADLAWDYFDRKLGDVLFYNLNANYATIELLSPLFEDGFHKPPSSLQSKSSQTGAINMLALAFSNIGELEKAMNLQSMSFPIYMEEGFNASLLLNAIRNYSSHLLDLNRFAEAYRIRKFVKDFALQIDVNDAIYRTNYSLFVYYVITGQWDQAESLYAILKDGDVTYRPDMYKAWVAEYYVQMHLQKNEDIGVALDNAICLVEDCGEIRVKESLYFDIALDRLRQNNFASVYEHLAKSIEIANRTGKPIARYLSTMGLAYAFEGRSKEALNYLNTALNYRELPRNQAHVWADIAEIYMKLGQIHDASSYALKAYESAWADGPPHSNWYQLQRARQVLERLDLPLPSLSPFDPENIDKIPYEDDIFTYFADDINGARFLDRRPVKQQDFYLTHFKWLHVGTIACFGIEDEDIVDRGAKEYSSLSYDPSGEIVISRMGQGVAEPQSLTSTRPRKLFEELNIDVDLLLNMSKFFLILFIQSEDDETGEEVFAYVNVRTDRLETLLNKGDEGKRFNLKEYATIVVTGQNRPTQEIRDKMKRDYLFAEYHHNVRIFPPLDQVT